MVTDTDLLEREAIDIQKGVNKARYVKLRKAKYDDLLRYRGDQSQENFERTVNFTTADTMRNELAGDKDKLTGLENKQKIYESVSSLIEMVRRVGGSLRIFYLDLDNFKKYNDTYGHDRANEALEIIGHFISSTQRKYDHAARLFGDEYLVAEFSLSSGYTDLAQKLKVGLEEQQVKTPGINHLDFSVGTAEFNAGDSLITPDELIKRAEVAMYNAKQVNGSCQIFWAPGMAIPPKLIDSR